MLYKGGKKMQIITSKTGAVNIMYSVVWDKESFFPPHEDCSPVSISHGQQGPLEIILDMTECGEARPMNHVLLLIRAPVLCNETIPTPNNLGVKVGCQFGPVFCEPTNAEVATEEGRIKVHVLGRDSSSLSRGKRHGFCVLTTMVTFTS